MSRIHKLKEGDLLVRRADKKPYIVLEIKSYKRKVYGAGPSGENRKIFSLLSPAGKTKIVRDTSVKVEFYLPGDPWFDDIR
jgi:hypothetical protein